jgi:hypothetical protein
MKKSVISSITTLIASNTTPAGFTLISLDAQLLSGRAKA